MGKICCFFFYTNKKTGELSEWSHMNKIPTVDLPGCLAGGNGNGSIESVQRSHFVWHLHTRPSFIITTSLSPFPSTYQQNNTAKEKLWSFFCSSNKDKGGCNLSHFIYESNKNCKDPVWMWIVEGYYFLSKTNNQPVILILLLVHLMCWWWWWSRWKRKKNVKYFPIISFLPFRHHSILFRFFLYISFSIILSVLVFCIHINGVISNINTIPTRSLFLLVYCYCQPRRRKKTNEAKPRNKRGT